MSVNLELFDKQIEFIESTERNVLLQSGIGYGKSYVGALWAVLTAIEYSDTRGLVVARDYPQLKMATLEEIKKVFQQLDLIEGTHYDWNKSTNDIKFFNGTVIYCRGANNYDSAFRGGNIGFIMADECDYYKTEAWLTLKGRLRSYPELLRAVSSPKGFNHIYNDFFVNNDETKKVITATTYDNPLLSDDYIKDLKSTYSPRLFEQEVLAKRLRINVGLVYNEFDRNIHVKDCKHLLTDRDQLRFFTDYNISNYCGCYFFKRDGVTYVIGEEHLQFQGSEVMALTIKAKYPTRPVIVIGDSTGNNKRDVAISRTNYQHFRDAGLLTENFLNPPVESRIIITNSELNHKRVIIDPSCKNLIRDLELLPWKEDGTGIDKRDITLSHSSDAFSYGVYYHSEYIKRPKTLSHSVMR